MFLLVRSVVSRSDRTKIALAYCLLLVLSSSDLWVVPKPSQTWVHVAAAGAATEKSDFLLSYFLSRASNDGRPRARRLCTKVVAARCVAANIRSHDYSL